MSAVRMITIVFPIMFIGSFTACDEQEAPKIMDVQVIQCPDTAFEEVLDDGDRATCSPIEVRGRITDNVAVVSPIIALKAWRDGVENPTRTIGPMSLGRDGEFSFDSIEDLVLIPGNHIDLDAVDSEGNTTSISIRFEWIGYDESLDQDWLAMTFQTTDDGGPDLEWLDVDIEPAQEGIYVRAGVPLSVHVEGVFAETGVEVLSLEACIAEIPGRNVDIDIVPEGGDGEFSNIITLLDPGALGETPKQEGEATYRVKVEAWDIPDQGETEGRYSVWPGSDEYFEFTFAMPGEAEDETPPVIEFETPDTDEIEGTIESSVSTYTFSGTILDNAGYPVRVSIESSEGRVFSLNPYGEGIRGEFSQTVQLSGAGEERLRFTAADANANAMEEPIEFPITYSPDITDPAEPVLLISEIYPRDLFFDYAYDDSSVSDVELGECLFISGSVSDDEGWTQIFITTEPEDILVFPWNGEDAGINLAGGFPAEQWRQVEVCDLTTGSLVTIETTDASGYSDSYEISFLDDDGDDFLEVLLN